MDAHGIAVVDRFAIAVRGRAIKLQLTWEHLLAEVAFADEIRDDVDDLAVHHLVHFAHVGLFFPEAADDFAEEAAAADGVGVQVRRCAGVRIRGGTVTDDDEGGVCVSVQGQDGSWNDGVVCRIRPRPPTRTRPRSRRVCRALRDRRTENWELRIEN